MTRTGVDSTRMMYLPLTRGTKPEASGRCHELLRTQNRATSVSFRFSQCKNRRQGGEKSGVYRDSIVIARWMSLPATNAMISWRGGQTFKALKLRLFVPMRKIVNFIFLPVRELFCTGNETRALRNICMQSLAKDICLCFARLKFY